MNDIFWEWLDEFIIVYIDDILVYNNSMEEPKVERKKIVCQIWEMWIWGDENGFPWT
jgi:hypothetical protein